MDKDIRCRLLSAEEAFLAAVVSGAEAIEAFYVQWHSILQDWMEHCDTLDEDMMDLANTTSHRIASLGEDFLNHQTRASSIADGLDEHVTAIFDSSQIGRASSPSFRGSDKVLPSTWLLQNLHNPYPSQALRESMQLPVDSTAKSVSEWFAKARKRIGWTRLVSDRFNGSRTAAAEAAYWAYVRDDHTNHLDPDLMTAFLAIKSHAELVFAQNTPRGSNECPGSSRSASPTPSLTYSSNNEDSDDDIPSPTVPLAGQKRSISRESNCDLDDRPSKRARSLFPSDSASPHIDELAIKIDQIPLMDEHSILVGPCFSDYLWNSVPHPADELASQILQPQLMDNHSVSVGSCLPYYSSVPPPADELAPQVLQAPLMDDHSSIDCPILPSAENPQSKRKRTLSDAAIDRQRPKRPRGQNNQRQQAVSDPLPFSYLDGDLDAWFENTFKMPSPASIDPIDTLLWSSESSKAVDLNTSAETRNEPSISGREDFPSGSVPDSLPFSETPSTHPARSISTHIESPELAWGDYFNFDLYSGNSSSPEWDSGAISNQTHPPKFGPDLYYEQIITSLLPTKPLTNPIDINSTLDDDLDSIFANLLPCSKEGSQSSEAWLAPSTLQVSC